MVRFFHTSDWHLGMTRHFFLGEAQERFTQDRIDGVREIGRLAEERQAAFVVVCGDVFDSNQVKKQTVLRALDAIREIPVPVYILPANHDSFDPSSVYRGKTFLESCPDNLTVITDSNPIQVPGTNGVTLVGVPWFTKKPLEDLIDSVLDRLEDTDGIVICLGHGPVDTLTPDLDNPGIIRVSAIEKRISDGQVHYVALGDRHSATSIGKTGAIWYSGSHLPTFFTEDNSGKILVVDLSEDAQPVVEEHSIGEWRFEELQFDLNTDEDLDSFEQTIEGIAGKERIAVRAAFQGTLTLAQKARFDYSVSRFEEQFASFRTWDRYTSLAVMPDAVDAEAVGLSGYARDAWQELVAKAESSGSDGDVATRALSLFYRIAEEVER